MSNALSKQVGGNHYKDFAILKIGWDSVKETLSSMFAVIGKRTA